MSSSLISLKSKNTQGPLSLFNERRQELKEKITTLIKAGENTSSLKVRLSGDLIESCRITQEVALKLLSRNQYGDIVKENIHGNHPVISLKGIHFKSATEHDPIDTGMEMSLYLLHTLLFGKDLQTGLAPSTLLLFEGVEIEELPSKDVIEKEHQNEYETFSGSNKSNVFFSKYPQYKSQLSLQSKTFYLQAATTISGQSLSEALKNESLSWDLENFSTHILASFLTIPSDDNLDNFIVTTDPSTGRIVAKIIGVDYDMAFAYPLTVYGAQREHIVGFKNGLLYFEEMMDQPVAPRVRERLRSLDPIFLGLEWAAATLELSTTFPQQESSQVKLPLRFTKNTLQDLIENLQVLKRILSEPKLETVTHRQLFRHLFPVVEHYYSKLGQNIITTPQAIIPRPLTTEEKITKLFNRPPSVEACPGLDVNKKLQNGMTVKDILDAAQEKSFSAEEKRDQSIEELCIEVLQTMNLNELSPAKQCALLKLTAHHFSALANRELHSSWKNPQFPFLLIREKKDLATFVFLEELGIDMTGQDEKGNTLLHLLARDGYEISSEVLERLNLPHNSLNRNGQTPLTLALQAKNIKTVIALIEAGGGADADPSLAWEFYRDVVRTSNHPSLTQAFNKFISKNPSIAFRFAMELIFPLRDTTGTPIKIGMVPLRGERMLHPEAASQLWVEGKFQRVNTFGKRSVNKFVLEDMGNVFTLYFKERPEFPGIEKAVGTLMNQIMGFGAPRTDLLHIKGVSYLVSQEVSGSTLQEVIKSDVKKLDKLNNKQLSQLLLMTMLINPEDGKADNQVVESIPGTDEYQIVSIDNDHAFVPSVARVPWIGGKKMRVQVKTVLYCLDQMNDPIESSVREQFLLHEPGKILSDWLNTLTHVDNFYTGNFNPEERKKLFNIDGVFLGIPFRPEMIAQLYRKMVKMQFLLYTAKGNLSFSHMDLLKQLDKPLADRYAPQLSQKKDPIERFIFVDGEDYDIDLQKNVCISTRGSRELLNSLNIKTEIDIKQLIENRSTFNPEQMSEELKKLVKAEEVNLVQQNFIRRYFAAEGDNVTFNSLKEEQISDVLKTINFVDIPTPVEQAILNQINKKAVWTKLSLVCASTVTNAYLASLNFQELLSLNVPYCQKLTAEIVELLLSKAPKLKELNLSGINSFKEIHGSIRTPRKFGQPRIPLHLKGLTHLVLNECSNLQVLEIDGPMLISLKAKNCHLLTAEKLYRIIQSCPNLVELDIEGCRSLIFENKEIMEIINFRRKFPHYPLNIFMKLASGDKEIIISLLSNTMSRLVPNLSYNKEEFSKALWLAIKSNTSLNEIYLDSCEFDDDDVLALVEALKTNTSITKLKLSLTRNKIGNKGAEALAEFNKRNTTITNLSLLLECNSIGEEGIRVMLPMLFTRNGLKEITLHHNKIGSRGIKILFEYSHINPLNPLYVATQLHHNEISDEGAEIIAQFLQNNANEDCKDIDLRGSKISDRGAKAIAKVLPIYAKRITLNLSSNQIGNAGANAIAHAIKEIGENTNLERSYITLILDNNAIGDSGAILLAMACIEFAKVSLPDQRFFFRCLRLDLNDNNIGDVGAGDLAGALKAATSACQIHISLNKNKISNKGAQLLREASHEHGSSKYEDNDIAIQEKLQNRILQNACYYKGRLYFVSHNCRDMKNEEIKILANILTKMTFTTFNISSINSDQESSVILSVIKNNKIIESLGFNNNKLGDLSLKILEHILENNNSLKELSLQGSVIGVQILKCLVSVLKGTSVRKLNLASNKIGDEEMDALAPVLNDTLLTELNLSSNKIGISGIKILANLLSNNQHLVELDLDSNDIDDEMLFILLEALKNNNSLVTLKLSGNKITDKGANFIVKTLQYNQSIKTLYFWSNEISKEGEAAINRAMARNPSPNTTNPSSVSTDKIPDDTRELKLEDFPEGLYHRANILEGERHFHDAIDTYLKAAKMGHTKALDKLHVLSQNSSHAQCALGELCEIQGRLKEAIPLYAQAASGSNFSGMQALNRLAYDNHSAAQSQLALLMEYGLGTEENLEQAIKLHEMAVIRGEGVSMLHLGLLYYRGLSTEENQQKALELVNQAYILKIPEANVVKHLIEQENHKKEEIIKRAKSIEDALYQFTARKTQNIQLSSSASSSTPLISHEQEVIYEHQQKESLARQEMFQKEERELRNQILILENRKTLNNQTFLNKQIAELQTKLETLRADVTRHTNNSITLLELARQGYKNQKMKLFYIEFKEKISVKFQGGNAILGKAATRNTGMSEDIGSSTIDGVAAIGGVLVTGIPGAGAVISGASYAANKSIKYKMDKKIEDQIRKIQTYYPEQGAAGADQFSSFLASCLVYRFQDQIIHLKPESLEQFMEYCVVKIADFLFTEAPESEGASDDIFRYQLFQKALLHQHKTISTTFKTINLKTDDDLELSLDDLLLSTGVQTIHGGKYLPTDPSKQVFLDKLRKHKTNRQIEYSLYRWGTKEEVELLTRMKIEMKEVERERSGTLAITIDNKKAAASFVQAARELTNTYLALP